MSHFFLKLPLNLSVSGALIYCPPGPDHSLTSNLMEDIAPYVVKFTNFTILGDLNFHLDEPNCTTA